MLWGELIIQLNNDHRQGRANRRSRKKIVDELEGLYGDGI